MVKNVQQTMDGLDVVLSRLVKMSGDLIFT